MTQKEATTKERIRLMKKATISLKNRKKKEYLLGSLSKIAHSWQALFLIFQKDWLQQRVRKIDYFLIVEFIGVDIASANSKIDWETFL